MKRVAVPVCLYTISTMNSMNCNASIDFEPRELPQPAPRFNSPPVLSVPEVSLIFDKPHDVKSYESNVRQSPSMEKYDSYANWKQTALMSNDACPGYIAHRPRHSVGLPLERCHSQSEANKLYKNVNSNESLKHSRSDPSLARKIDTLKITQEYNKDCLSKVIQNSQMLSPNVDNMLKNNSCSHDHVENNCRSTGNRSPYFDGERQENIPNTVYKNNDRHCMRAPNPNTRLQQFNFESKHSNYHPKIQKLEVNQHKKSSSRLQSEYINPGLQNSNCHSGSPNSKNFHPNMFPRSHHFLPYCDSEYGYPYPHPYLPNVQSLKNENEETVRNLLQLINNQSEQIKSLQSQVERLLKIQEESLKDREKCKCAHNMGLVSENYEQNAQFSIQTMNNNPVHSSGTALKLSRDDSLALQRHNGTVERNTTNSTNIKEMKKNLTSDYSNPNYDMRINQAARDEHLKNKILEQKVSIGVMTSFEFTVQNNPFASETEDRKQYYGQTQAEIDKVNSHHDNEELLDHNNVSNTCQNVFSRVSNLPLENIIEDSESHLSLSQQPSSNFHSSPTINESKFSESINRKTAKNPSTGKDTECNPKLFDCENSEDAQCNDRKNYLCSQKKQIADMRQHFENTQRLQSSKSIEHSSTKSSFHTDNLLKQGYSEPFGYHRQNPDDQNSILPTQNSNAYPLSHKSGTDGTKQYREQEIFNASTQQKEHNSPYYSERQHGSDKLPTSQNDLGNCFDDTNEPRSQKSSVANWKERNRVLSLVKSNRENYIEESIVLNSGELEINERPPPSPEPSIHVEMQEYSSDDESERPGGEQDKQTPKVGWTFYNNVLGQVNQILQNSPITRNLKEKTVDKENVDDLKNKPTLETVKIATMEQLRQLGISFAENNDLKDAADMNNKKVTFDSSYYPRLEYRGNMTQATSTMSETDTSMHMNALALKYLSDEQLGELALQKHNAETLKQLMVSNVQGTNMSFATMRYLERYQLLPTNNKMQNDNERRVLEKPKFEELRATQRPSSNSQMTRMSCPSKILDISTLKQQPKLL